MAVKFLGQFLLERGLITPQQLLAATEAQRASNPLLGELAVRQGLLTEAQARRINERQRAEDRRFGDIAIELGLLDAREVEALLSAQKAGRKLFGQVLVEQGVLDAETLEQALAEHHAEQQAGNEELAGALAGHRLGALAQEATELCVRLFPRMLGTQCQPVGLVDDALPTATWPYTAHVRISGERSLRVGLSCDRATLQALACAFLRMPSEQCDSELAVDALGEIVNVLMGYVVRNTLPDDADYRATPPDFSRTAASLVDEGALALQLNSPLGQLLLLVGD
ncbi:MULTISPECIES: chemotaxis protein CheX [Pseudoxanthomonas]|uniref:Chemotaxis phosphatase CheX-like protein n=1 Tax=Pseudoxanthomonas taiwanensis J19 TaxID=935569 RepID=A0A562D8G8_9GAMM|nr:MULTISPECIES: chemotaxis protein CheX [Pseudoxanthomonas]TWH05993.1 chemotaxis phosphatase CheX-like protein [Pseudoxanthomonas taiwanensis J19]